MLCDRFIAVFDNEHDLLAGVQAYRAAEFDVVDVHTPYAVHGLDEAMGLRRSRLPWACFAFGAFGALFMLWFQFWSNTVDWPLNVGGRPWNSLPAFGPVIFEVMVLCAGLGTVAMLLIRCGLFPGRQPYLPFPGITDDRYVVVVCKGCCGAFDADEAYRIGHRHHAVDLVVRSGVAS